MLAEKREDETRREGEMVRGNVIKFLGVEQDR